MQPLDEFTPEAHRAIQDCFAVLAARGRAIRLEREQRERQLITTLAERLRRSQSDAVRFVVLEAARQLAEQRNEILMTERDAMQQMGVPQYALIG